MDTMSNGAGAPAEHTPTTFPVRRAVRGRPVSRALLAILALCLTVLGLVPSTAAADDPLVKVFVVADPAQTGEQTATLQSIATATLRDSSRSGEIFDLNRGRAQPDGGALNSPADPLRAGWILRLPQDAAGPDVKLARDSTQTSGAEPALGGPSSAPGAHASGSSKLNVPLPAAIATLGAVLLALVTAVIVGRRSVSRSVATLRRAVYRLGGPARRRRRLAARQAVGQAFAADTESVRHAHQVLTEFAATPRGPEKPVHAVSVGNGQVTAWLHSSDSAEAPWERLGRTRWRRSAATSVRPGGTPGAGERCCGTACLTRVGVDDEQRPVFVDLSRLDGVLSVTGDAAVAHGIVQNLLTEILRIHPGLPVTVLRDGVQQPPFALPQGTVRQQSPVQATPWPTPDRSGGIIVGAAGRRPVAGVVVLAGSPSERESDELAALCGPGGAGWTGLVCGDVDGAHWRWYADAEGRVDVPILDLRLTVPA